ncbi:MAG: hypothetical protein HPY52_10905 [Firmicutes bacterium]|nr:hypothetical protein [Bacillota bacterium]
MIECGKASRRVEIRRTKRRKFVATDATGLTLVPEWVQQSASREYSASYHERDGAHEHM